MKADVIGLTQLQLSRLDVINKSIAGFITVSEAAQTLGLSERQIKRLKKDVSLNGAAALIHKNSVNKSPHAISDDTISKIISLKKSDIYKNANFVQFRELLSEHHGIDISYSTLHSILSDAGMKSPMTRRRYKPHRRRKRRPQEGLLLQVDATPFAWFGGRIKYSLHGAIDDATGQITALYLCKNECLQGYFEMLRRTINNYGIPISIYADRHTIFRSPKADKLTAEEILDGVTANDTQFGRCLNELGIQLIAARSPQAKGRIERLWQTLQSRLPVEFLLHGIDNIDDANVFLDSYLYSFNSCFAVEPENTDKAFRKLSPGFNLDYCLCVKMQRQIDGGGIFSYGGKLFKIEDSKSLIHPQGGSKMTVLVSPQFGIKAQYGKYVYETTRYIRPKKIQVKPNDKEKSSKKTKGNSNFGRPTGHHQNVGFDTDKDIRRMLEDIFLNKYA